MRGLPGLCGAAVPGFILAVQETLWSEGTVFDMVDVEYARWLRENTPTNAVLVIPQSLSPGHIRIVRRRSPALVTSPSCSCSQPRPRRLSSPTRFARSCFFSRPWSRFVSMHTRMHHTQPSTRRKTAPTLPPPPLISLPALGVSSSSRAAPARVNVHTPPPLSLRVCV